MGVARGAQDDPGCMMPILARDQPPEGRSPGEGQATASSSGRTMSQSLRPPDTVQQRISGLPPRGRERRRSARRRAWAGASGFSWFKDDPNFSSGTLIWGKTSISPINSLVRACYWLRTLSRTLSSAYEERTMLSNPNNPAEPWPTSQPSTTAPGGSKS